MSTFAGDTRRQSAESNRLASLLDAATRYIMPIADEGQALDKLGTYQDMPALVQNGRYSRTAGIVKLRRRAGKSKGVKKGSPIVASCVYLKKPCQFSIMEEARRLTAAIQKRPVKLNC